MYTVGIFGNTVVKVWAVAAYSSSKHLLPFAIAGSIIILSRLLNVKTNKRSFMRSTFVSLSVNMYTNRHMPTVDLAISILVYFCVDLYKLVNNSFR